MKSFLVMLKNWFLGWFTESNKNSVVALLNQVQDLVDFALPIVKAIDEKLKPNLPEEWHKKVSAVTAFLSEYLDEELDKIVELANQFASQPLADMLANIALEVLKRKTNAASFSSLRLAVELAYSIYKAANK